MKNSRMLIVAAVAICGVAFASTGVSQTKTTTVKRSKTSKVTTTSNTKKKVEAAQRETNEQRLRRLQNEKRVADCLELLKAASGGSVNYDEGQCSIKLSKGREYIKVFLEKADISVGVNSFVATCRSSNTSQCVSEDGAANDPNPGVASFNVFFKTSQDARDAKQCLDFLHQRCKKM